MAPTFADRQPTFETILVSLTNAFRIVEQKVAPPTLTMTPQGLVPRFREKTAHQAAIQKAARYISGLNALVILLSQGYLQEQCVIQRTLDELGEDIMFLIAQPQTSADVAIHARFLKAFYEEEFDLGVAPIDSKKRRDQIKRRQIREYVYRRLGPIDPKTAQVASVMTSAYSGYVHSASPHIMEMCWCSGFRFQLSGSKTPELLSSHVDDAMNYFFRGLLNIAAIASVLGEPKLYENLKLQADTLAMP